MQNKWQHLDTFSTGFSWNLIKICWMFLGLVGVVLLDMLLKSMDARLALVYCFSIEKKALAQKRAEKEGLQNLISFVVCDYRAFAGC